MRVLVIGARLVGFPAESGHEVTALVRRPAPGPGAGVRLVEGDLRAPDRLDAELAGADAIIDVSSLRGLGDQAGSIASDA